MRAVALVALAAFCVAGCDTPNFRTSQQQFGSSAVLASTGNLRFVSERESPQGDGRQRIVCTEPSPDYAVASGTDGQLTVKTTTPLSELDGSVKTTEQVTNLGGRDKGVLALRDGLYAACQAYANGLIGKDAYSVILSQYGMLLVALTGSGTLVDKKGKPVSPADAGSPFAAMLVACISAYDSSRPTAGSRNNTLLDPATCRGVLRRAASGQMG